MDIGELFNNAKHTCITITLQKYTVIPKRHRLTTIFFETCMPYFLSLLDNS